MLCSGSAYGAFRSQQTPLIAGVVPHHLLASEAIGSFFTELAKQKPKTIIILSPNHFHTGKTPLITSDKTITENNAPVQIEKALLTKLTSSLTTIGPEISIQPSAIAKDHGITSLTPFIHSLLPQTKILPILISGGTSQKTLLQLTNFLSAIASSKTPVILSSDFSHYLKEKDAIKKDAITKDLIETSSANSILELNNNDFLDSPEGLFVILNLAKKQKAKFQLMYHSNSNSILDIHDTNTPVTTYFIYAFRKI